MRNTEMHSVTPHRDYSSTSYPSTAAEMNWDSLPFSLIDPQPTCNLLYLRATRSYTFVLTDEVWIPRECE